jgi:hypothetical protein
MDTASCPLSTTNTPSVPSRRLPAASSAIERRVGERSMVGMANSATTIPAIIGTPSVQTNELN